MRYRLFRLSLLETVLAIGLPFAANALVQPLDLAALGATADANSAYGSNPASRGIDGNTSTHWMSNGSGTMWYRVDLKGSHNLVRIDYWGATDRNRPLNDFDIYVTDSSSTSADDWGTPVLTAQKTQERIATFTFPQAAAGRYLIFNIKRYESRGSVAELVIYESVPDFVIANPITGSDAYLTGGQATAAHLAENDAYDRCLITDSATLPALPVAQWQAYSPDMDPASVVGAFTPPTANGELSLYFWLGDSTGTLEPICERDTILWTTNAPVIQAQDLFRPSVTGATVTVAASAFDAGTTGGFYGDFPLTVFSRHVSSAMDLDDPDNPQQVTLAPSATPYEIVFTAMNAAGVTASTSVVLTVQGPLHWNPGNTGGGAGAWGTASWSDDANYPAGELVSGTWTASQPSPAILGGTAGGNVTLGGGTRYVSRLEIDAPGYVLSNGYVTYPQNGELMANEDATIRNLTANKGVTITKRGAGTVTTVDYFGGNQGRVTIREGAIVATTLGIEAVYTICDGASMIAAKDGIASPMKNKVIVESGGLFDLAGHACGIQSAILRIEEGGRMAGRGGSIGAYAWNQQDGELTIRGTVEMGGGTLFVTRSGSSALAAAIDGGVLDLGDGGRLVFDDGTGNRPSVSLSGGGVITNGAVWLTGTATAAARTQTVSVPDDTVGDDFTIRADILDGGQTGSSLAKAGTGTLRITGDCLFTGGLAVSGGTLVLEGARTNAVLSVAAGATFQTAPGATVQVNPGDEMTVSGTIDLSGATLDVRLAEKEDTPLIRYALGTADIRGLGAATVRGGWHFTNDAEAGIVYLRPKLGTVILFR